MIFKAVLNRSEKSNKTARAAGKNSYKISTLQADKFSLMAPIIKINVIAGDGQTKQNPCHEESVSKRNRFGHWAALSDLTVPDKWMKTVIHVKTDLMTGSVGILRFDRPEDFFGDQSAAFFIVMAKAAERKQP